MTSWSEERREAARIHADRLAATKARETQRARELIQDFLSRAREAGRAAEPLRVSDYSGRGSARTGLTGWYLKSDRSVGIDTDGNFYVLTARLNLADKMRGYRPQPSDPPLVVGAGGRDGESLDLADALANLLRP